MKKKNNKSNPFKRVETLGLLFVFSIPVVVLIFFLNKFLLAHPWIPFTLVMPGVVAAGAISLISFYISFKRTIQWRAISFFTLSGIFISAYFIFTSVVPATIAEASPSLLPCPVCGYKTLLYAEDPCNICGVEYDIKQMNLDEYENMQDFLIAEQCIYFMDNIIEDSVHFFDPQFSKEGYLKDKNWKPNVTQEQVLDLSKKYKEKLEHP